MKIRATNNLKMNDHPLGRLNTSIEDFEMSLRHSNARITCCFPKIQPLKIYILIRESVDVGHAVNCAAHASLCLYLRHENDPLVREWAFNSFRKVSCVVTDDEFERAKQFEGFELITESKLPQPEVALVFKPRVEWDSFFKTLKLYGSK